MEIKKNIIWLIAIILMAVFSFSAYPQEHTVVYELIIDFGNDNVFIHEVTTKKWYCDERVKFLHESEGIKAYCVRRSI